MIRKLIGLGLILLAIGYSALAAMQPAQAQRSLSVNSWTRLAGGNIDLRAGVRTFSFGRSGRFLRAISFRTKRHTLTIAHVSIYLKNGRRQRITRRIVLRPGKRAGTIGISARGQQVVRVVVSIKRQRTRLGRQWLEIWGLPGIKPSGRNPSLANRDRNPPAEPRRSRRQQPRPNDRQATNQPTIDRLENRRLRQREGSYRSETRRLEAERGKADRGYAARRVIKPKRRKKSAAAQRRRENAGGFTIPTEPQARMTDPQASRSPSKSARASENPAPPAAPQRPPVASSTDRQRSGDNGAMAMRPKGDGRATRSLRNPQEGSDGTHDDTAAAEREPPPVAANRDLTAPDSGATGGSQPAAHPQSTKDYDVMPIFYGTDRVNAAKPGKQPIYNTKRAEKLQLGFALVTVPKSHEMPNVERPWSITLPIVGKIQLGWEDPKKHFTIKELRALQEAEFLELVKQKLKTSINYKDQALIFIHGFNNSFEGALFRTAQIAFDLKFDGAPFVYSWPSAGTWTSYPYDRESASAARPYLKKFLQLVSQKSGAKSVSIIAHSMGTFALLNVLRDLKYQAPDSVKINQIILAAPDIGVNEFKILAKEIKGLSAGVTLYASANDRALYVSREYHGGVARAGDVPAQGPIVVSGVDSIDVSAISIETLATNHSSYAQTKEL